MHARRQIERKTTTTRTYTMPYTHCTWIHAMYMCRAKETGTGKKRTWEVGKTTTAATTKQTKQNKTKQNSKNQIAYYSCDTLFIKSISLSVNSPFIELPAAIYEKSKEPKP